MPDYEVVHFNPPAPVAEVELRNPETHVTVSAIMLLVDTGADVTLLPRVSVEYLGISTAADQRYELMGFDGNVSFSPVVTLDMVFLKQTFRGRYLLIDEAWGILGRDVLNHVCLLFDGPQRKWREYSS